MNKESFGETELNVIEDVRKYLQFEGKLNSLYTSTLMIKSFMKDVKGKFTFIMCETKNLYEIKNSDWYSNYAGNMNYEIMNLDGTVMSDSCLLIKWNSADQSVSFKVKKV